MATSVALLVPEVLFPRGVAQYVLGGGLIGLGIALIYLGTGIMAGASTFLESTLSYVSSLQRFNRPKYLSSRSWRVIFTVGIIIGAAISALLFQDGLWITDVQWWRLFGGGILVGIGTRIGKGCTSGHGICGVGSRSRASLANVAVFLMIAIGTAQIVQAIGIVP